MIKFFVGLTLFATSLLATSQIHAQDEVAVAKNQLLLQVELLEDIAFVAERAELARITILKQADQRVLTLIDSVGLANMQTLREYQVQIVTFRFSQEFLNSIITESTRKAHAAIYSIQQQIISDRGFDDTPYTRVAYSIFTQMHSHFQLLKEQPISTALIQKIDALNISFGNVIALAEQGDRPRTFEAAKVLYFEVQALYPELDAISGSSPAYDLSLTIRGLNEFYAEFGQVHEAGEQ